MIKKMTTVMLLLAALCMALAGCGKQPGSEFVGTWKYSGQYRGEHYDKTYDIFYVIEKAQNGDTAYIVTKYELKNDVAKPSGKTKLDTNKKQFPAHYKDGILERDSSKKFYLENGKLREGNSEQVYERVSDKSMTFDEMNNGRGYPEPK
jgi:hypothetical protein